ncbi:MAG: nickel pincer cofactor biosynthesis protein LarC [Planctomycetota bacterium]
MARLAYLDCQNGISGDMILGALVDAGVDAQRLNEVVGSLGVPGLALSAAEVKKRGFRATQVTVACPPEEKHRHLHHIVAMIEGSQLTPRQKERAIRVFNRLAEAEAKVHGTTVEKVHFHEVGAADSIADVVGGVVAFDLLNLDRIVASPVAVGAGRVRIAHGECSVPAPATAELLRGIPLAASIVTSELTTPTGAAFLATLVDEFGSLPDMVVEAIGYGAGQKDFEEQANVLRVLVGEVVGVAGVDRVCVMETNLDDVSGELVGYCVSRLFDAGALDVFTTAIQMKKGRPGTKLTVLCRPADALPLQQIVFRETTTLGVRRWLADRQVLPRRSHVVQTQWGPIEGKVAWLDDGTARFAPEFEACRRIADETSLPLRIVYETAIDEFDAGSLTDKDVVEDARD